MAIEPSDFLGAQTRVHGIKSACETKLGALAVLCACCRGPVDTEAAKGGALRSFIHAVYVTHSREGESPMKERVQCCIDCAAEFLNQLVPAMVPEPSERGAA